MSQPPWPNYSLASSGKWPTRPLMTNTASFFLMWRLTTETMETASSFSGSSADCSLSLLAKMRLDWKDQQLNKITRILESPTAWASSSLLILRIKWASSCSSTVWPHCLCRRVMQKGVQCPQAGTLHRSAADFCCKSALCSHEKGIQLRGRSHSVI